MGAVRATGHYKHFHKPWETIRQPASVIIAEPSSSGKSELVENLSKEKKTLIRPAPPRPPSPAEKDGLLLRSMATSI